MVFHRRRVTKSTFRNLPFGALYWLTSATGVAPFVKTGRATRANTLGDGVMTNTAVATTSVAVTRVPSVFVSITK